jgi:hypothetical protein
VLYKAVPMQDATNPGLPSFFLGRTSLSSLTPCNNLKKVADSEKKEKKKRRKKEIMTQNLNKQTPDPHMQANMNAKYEF